MSEILKVGDIRPLVEGMPGFNQWSEWFDDQAETPLHAALMEACWNGLRWGCEALGLLPAWEQFEAVERPAREQYKAVKRTAWERYEPVERMAREQYEAVVRTAWEQYKAVVRTALESLSGTILAACAAMLVNRS